MRLLLCKAIFIRSHFRGVLRDGVLTLKMPTHRATPTCIVCHCTAVVAQHRSFEWVAFCSVTTCRMRHASHKAFIALWLFFIHNIFFIFWLCIYQYGSSAFIITWRSGNSAPSFLLLALAQHQQNGLSRLWVPAGVLLLAAPFLSVFGR